MNVEILAPAGDEQCARAALLRGANAVYLGLKEFSARESAENFEMESLREITDFAHILGAKVYVCLNTLVKDDETQKLFLAARAAWQAGADAILAQDLFLGKALKEAYPQMELHLSTQAGTCNVYGATLAKEFGFSRVVLARETPLEEIKKITKIIETEVFVQGALCTCFSGQCYLSSFAGNNSGNRGRCKQPCRKRYQMDRAGYEKTAYALSPSDLSVGERVFELLEAGVTSLKIEGRLRRIEYVCAAVDYYRALLEKRNATAAFSRLTRAFNRGDYTKGLAFGQKKDFLSRSVQGHIGEKVGEISLKKGKYFCLGKANLGDGFKILRGGEEVGGATCVLTEKEGFYLSSAQKLQAGDEVRITTDTQNLPEFEEGRRVSLNLKFIAGERPVIECGKTILIGEDILPQAKNAPLREEDLKACFQKTDGAPFAVEFESVVTQNAFLPKSALNELRRQFYRRLIASFNEQREELPPMANEEFLAQKEERIAIIASNFKGLKADILIYKPQDYANITPESVSVGEGEKFLYLPAYFTSADEENIKSAFSLFDGFYCDGYYGFAIAKAYGKKLFAGTGCNLTNRYAVKRAFESGASHVALSKELSSEELNALSQKGTFALSLGAVKVMDLCYCPFEQTCANCDKREFYTLTDEGGRSFPLRRVRFAQKPCRFELYNCAPLVAFPKNTGVLADFTVENSPRMQEILKAKSDGGQLKNATKGHFNRSLL